MDHIVSDKDTIFLEDMPRFEHKHLDILQQQPIFAALLV